MSGKKTPKYIQRVLDKLNSGQLEAGTVHEITVQHEEGCRLLRGEDQCDCNVVIGEVRPLNEKDEASE